MRKAVVVCALSGMVERRVALVLEAVELLLGLEKEETGGNTLAFSQQVGSSEPILQVVPFNVWYLLAR